ncbi:MAG TPA: ABC transporter substrate-binding protein, partial [Burkholderiales bacterium]|nr:ABC transporter substrate-binding protein [Burkholderiales bacterium]
MNKRRQFLLNTTALAATAAFPLGARAQTAVKVGVLHPVTGFLAYSGNLSRLGATMAIEDINRAGGIKALGGAKLQAVLGDAQSQPQAGVAEVEKMNEA